MNAITNKEAVYEYSMKRKETLDEMMLMRRDSYVQFSFKNITMMLTI